MTNVQTMEADATGRLAESDRRWRESAAQVADTAAAVRGGNLGLANTDREMAARRARLNSHGLRLEAIIGTDDSLWTTFLSRGLTAARPVVRIVRVDHNERPVPVATGVLISPRLLLTNDHVLGTVTDTVGMAAQLGYEVTGDGQDATGEIVGFDPDRCWFTAPDLDFTVVAVQDLAGHPPADRYGYVPLIGQLGKTIKGEPLNVVHHPAGEPKKISIRANRLVAEDDTWLRYTSDTEPGSSGAPVFNDQWEMVALHHAALPATRRRGEPAPTDDAVVYTRNEGARVSQIVQRLRGANLTGTAGAAVAEALQAGAAA